MNLDNNNLSDSDILPLLRSTQNYNNLCVLNLSNNRIGDSSCYEFSQTLYLSINLKELYLHWNLITSTGFLHLLKYLPDNETLRILDISHNKLDKNFNKESSQYLAHLITSNTGLIHLDLSHNNIPESSFDTFKAALDKNHTLVGLHIEGNFAGAEIDHKGFLVKKMDMIDRRSMNRPRIKGLEVVRKSVLGTGHSNCWICEGWSLHTFTIELKDFDDFSPEDTIYVHL